VIGREEIDRSLAGDAADLLRFHAGLEIGRNGGPGQSTSIFIRGAERQPHAGDDRRRADQPRHDRTAAAAELAPELIERIEVVKGPRSALYGTDAIGGVVNVITRRGSRDGWTAEVGYGDYDTSEAASAADSRGARAIWTWGFPGSTARASRPAATIRWTAASTT
jgi:vitamin B12 transporter